MFANLTVPTITPCSLGNFLATLDDESRTHLESALKMSNIDVPHRRIAREIRNEADVTIDPETIASHRNGNCRCSKI